MSHLNRSRAITPVGAAAAALLASGCGLSAFSLSFRDNNPNDVRAAMAQVRSAAARGAEQPANSTGKPLAFLVTTDKPSRLIAYDLQASRAMWTVAGAITSRVIVGRDYIFHRGAGQMVGRRVSDGQIAWRAALPSGERLLGACADGDRLYVVTEVVKRDGGSDAGQLIAFDGTSGARRWANSSTGRIGAPSATGGLVFVPLRSQSIAVLKGDTGDEIARVRSKDEALLWVRTIGSAVLFGGNTGIYKLDEKAVSGSQAKSTFRAAPLPKSVRPVYWWNGYNAALAGYTAYDRNRLLWRVSAGEGLAFSDQMIFVHNYRFMFAFDTSGSDNSGRAASGKAKEGQGASRLRWAYSYPRHDAVASAYTGRSILMATAHGHLVALDARRGLPVAETDAKVSLRGATFDAAGYAAAGTPKGNADLRQTLKEVIWDPDRRFGAVKLFAVEQLAQLPGRQVSADLVNIVAKEKLDPAVYKRAGEMLVGRHDKRAIPLYLKTLKRRYSFVEGTRSRAVDVMAAALGDLKAPDAVQPLLAHLADHETPITALAAIVKALDTIGDKAVVEPFRDFLLTYRCDPKFGDKRAQGVLNLIAGTLLKMGGEEERQLLSFVQNDVHTLPALRTYIDKALRQDKPGTTKKRKRRASAR